MGKIGKITSIKKEYSAEYDQTLSGSLARNGYSRFPGTGVSIVPWKDGNGEYRTGLNENALYIKQMERTDPEAAEQEKIRVKSLREELEALTGLDLSSRSDYYSKMLDGEYGQQTRARIVKLKDGVNMFNLEDPFDAITYAWLRVHESVAPSLEAYKTGKVKNSQNIQFYVDDVDYQNEYEFTKNMKVNQAIINLTSMTPERQYKVARLLGLPVRQEDKPATIYNTLDAYIKASPKNGNSAQNVDLFTKITNLSEENFNVRFVVSEAIKYSIYREKNMKIWEGDTVVAQSKEDLIANLSTPQYQEDLIALEEKVRQKRLQEVI